MKEMMKTMGVLVVCAGALLAQDSGEKATVPLHDPARPARIRAHLMSGGITVRGSDRRDVLVEARAGSRDDREERREEQRERRHPTRADGMKRLELPGSSGLDITEEENVVNIKTASWNRPTDLIITVPRRSSLQLKCMNN